MAVAPSALAGLIVCLLPCAVGGTTFSVQCQQLAANSRPTCTFAKGVSNEADVTGRFYDEIDTTGWGRLYVRAPSLKPTSGFAAGYLEGALTADRIHQHLTNYKATANLTTVPKKLGAFVSETDAWIRAQLLVADLDDKYWSIVRFIYDQLDGLLTGANQYLTPDKHLTRLDLLLLGLIGDLSDIKLAVDESARLNFENMTGAEVSLWAQRHGHCSALIKLVPDGSELFIGHNMWWSYSAMLRIFKHYEFGSMQAISMSSFPGVLASADDFYQMDSLVVIETTTTVYNHSLLGDANAEALPYWIRAMTANYIAKTGPDWMNTFKRHNSGTYNNMWMVLDYSKFIPGLPLVDGLFTVGEQLPGYFHWEDQTHILSYGYWPSYNVALYPMTRTLSGQAQMELKHPQLSYQQNPRAQVFRRDQGTVQNDEDMQRIMRYNKFETDPLAHGNSCNQLACRADLANVLEGSEGVGGGGASDKKVQGTKAFGAVDAKYTSFAHVNAKRTIAIAGPTHDDQPVFQWSAADKSVQETSHLGHPDRFDFDWVIMSPEIHVDSPVWWAHKHDRGSYQFMLVMGIVCSIITAGAVGLARSRFGMGFKSRAEDNCYHKFRVDKFQDCSPGDLSTRAGSSVASPHSPTSP